MSFTQHGVHAPEDACRHLPQASLLVKTLERSSGRAMTIVSRGAIESMGASEYGLKAVGTGPFKVTDHQLGQSMTLERNENYWDPERPVVDKVVITPILNPEPLAAAIEAGDIHMTGGNPLPPELIDRFVSNKAEPQGLCGSQRFPSIENPWSRMVARCGRNPTAPTGKGIG